MSATDTNTLVATLEEARDAYYNGQPVLSDSEFDALEDELRAIDPKHAFLKGVGAKSKPSKWVKATHDAPMGSLLKAQTPDELKTWYDSRIADLLAYGASLPTFEDKQAFTTRVEQAQLVVSEKLDGISISLVFDDGDLKQAVTRGDGSQGEDIFRNVSLMAGIQASQKGFSGWERGEVILKKSTHKKHASEYKNTRNAASGISRRESDNRQCKHLTVIHYQAIRKGGKALKDKVTELKMLEARKCATPNWSVVEDATGVLEVYEEYLSGTRKRLDYDIDGLVIEFNDPEFMEILGERDGRPKGAIALKFPHEQKVTTLNNVRWQVGNSGRVTPVAEFDPVDIAGVTVSKASLHTIERVQALKLFKGCKVLISRRNDCIPYLEENLSEKSRA